MKKLGKEIKIVDWKVGKLIIHKTIFKNYKKIFLFLGLFLISLFAFPNNSKAINHDFTGLPLTADGWTDMEALVQEDSRIVYVSSSDGNDSTGQFYFPADTEIGSNPFDPTGVIKAYATFATAYMQLRDGYPDMLLFKQGDTWNDFPIVTITKGGRSQMERQIIASYGNANVRPRLITSGGAFRAAGSAYKNYLIIADLYMAPALRTTDVTGPSGISWEGNSSNILFEGNHIHYYRNNIVVQSNEPLGNPIISNIALRRNIITDSWSAQTHCQGIYIYGLKEGFLIEENVWDHNGWHELYQPQNTHSRNMYLGGYTDMIIRGNISAKSSSEGVQMRYGGVYEYNLDMQNSAAVGMGHSQTRTDVTGKIRYNVVLDARNINGSDRGFGISVGNRATNVEVYENILAHQRTGGPYNIRAIGTSYETKMNYQYQLNPDHCRNDILDGDETEVDCGGSCQACTCFNNSLDPGEQAIDCGVDGGCWPCAYVVSPNIHNNIVYKWDYNGDSRGESLFIGQATMGITVRDNIFQQPNGANMVDYRTGSQHNGPDSSWIFSGNTYYAGTNNKPFDAGPLDEISYPQWIAHVGETGSSNAQVDFPDPERTIESYAQAQGLNPSSYQDGVDKFLTEARKQSRFNWRQEYTAYNVVNYIREGFGREEVPYWATTAIRSDVDGSSEITTTDALLTLRNSLGLSMNGTAWQASATTGDVNCDGISNSTDALLILRYSLGLSMSGTGWCG